MRPIDADEVFKAAYDMACQSVLIPGCEDYAHGLREAANYIENAPTIDVAPVRHAYWVPCNVYCNHAQEFKCSGKDGCGRSTYYDHYTRYCDYDYCPNCGAEMDAGQEDDKNA